MTSPKPTIREKIREVLVGKSPKGYRLFFMKHGMTMGEADNMIQGTVDELLALLSPQTGGNEKLDGCSCSCHDNPITNWCEKCFPNHANPPQTGEGECQACKLKPFGTIAVDDVHNPHCIQCGRKIVSDSPLSEEMEKEFDGLELRTTEAEPPHTMVVDRKQAKAFLRKQLDLQEKRFREMIGQDEVPSLAIINLSKAELNTVKNEFRAELRSKLSSKK